jgi:prepilin-type N-terminal cleavage/methylation domain-containing protein
MSGRRAGFTLREIAIVLVILAITTGVVVPAFARLDEQDAAQPADAVLQLLRAARRTAIEWGITVRVVLDPTSGRFRVDTSGVGGTGTLADTALQLESGTTIESDSARLRFVFQPNGAAMADSVVVHSGRATTVVSVDPWSGVPHATER